MSKDIPSRGQDQGHMRQVFSKNKNKKSKEKVFKFFFFSRSPLEENKKRFSKICRWASGVFQQNFNG